MNKDTRIRTTIANSALNGVILAERRTYGACSWCWSAFGIRLAQEDNSQLR
jgi:hypothetical protein